MFKALKNYHEVFRQKVKIINADDQALQRRGYLTQDEVKQMDIDFLVDTGAYMLCINEDIQEQIQLPYVSDEEAVLADSSRIKMKIVGPVVIKIHNRQTAANALVLPRNSEPLLGSIPLKDMDLLVDPLMGQLVVPKDRPYLSRTIVK